MWVSVSGWYWEDYIVGKVKGEGVRMFVYDHAVYLLGALRGPWPMAERWAAKLTPHDEYRMLAQR